MVRALERDREGTATVIPIILSNCDWKKAPFAHIQGLPKDMIPIIDKKRWDNLEDAFTNVVMGIRVVVEKLQKIPPNP